MLLIWSFIGVASYSGLGGADISFRRLHIVNKAQIFGFWRQIFGFWRQIFGFWRQIFGVWRKTFETKIVTLCRFPSLKEICSLAPICHFRQNIWRLSSVQLVWGLEIKPVLRNHMQCIKFHVHYLYVHDEIFSTPKYPKGSSKPCFHIWYSSNWNATECSCTQRPVTISSPQVVPVTTIRRCLWQLSGGVYDNYQVWYNAMCWHSVAIGR